MLLLADQDVYQLTIDWLRDEGHDILTARELGMERSADDELLKKANAMGRVFVTRDKDFGAWAFLKAEEASGIILLRATPASMGQVHDELQRLFAEHGEEELKRSFCVVEPHRHRIRRLPQGS